MFMRGKYCDVILPMTVLRRLEAILEPTKQAVLKMVNHSLVKNIKVAPSLSVDIPSHFHQQLVIPEGGAGIADLVGAVEREAGS